MTTKRLPSEIEKRIKALIFERADNFGYATRTRADNSVFMDELVEDPEIGGVLKQYYPGERIRTYIKDAALNLYAKKKNKQLLAAQNLEDVISCVYGDKVEIYKKIDSETIILKSQVGDQFYVVGEGTVLKWETALRRALDAIANNQKFIVDSEYIKICLILAIINGDVTDATVKHIKSALDAVGVKVYFCS